MGTPVHSWDLLLDGRTIHDMRKFLAYQAIIYRYIIRVCMGCDVFRIEPYRGSWQPVKYVTGWRMLLPVIVNQEPGCLIVKPGAHTWQHCEDQYLTRRVLEYSSFVTWDCEIMDCPKCRTVMLKNISESTNKPVFLKNLLTRFRPVVSREDPGCLPIVKRK